MKNIILPVIYVYISAFILLVSSIVSLFLLGLIGKLKIREKNLKEISDLLKGQDRIKSEYVLRVSHDIKGDLAAIQSCLEPVARGITGELNPKQLDLIQKAVHRTSKLTIFVKALLETTRIKLSKEIKMDYFSFKDVLSEAVSYIALKAKDKNISLNAEVEPTIDQVRGSKECIQETLVNLLVNSVKYTPRDGKIDITARDKGSRILIDIADNGIGIPKDELPRIFEEFYRASNAKEVEKDGTGLGLSIAKQVIEIHNGKICAESEEGKGSIFHIELPK